MFRSTSHSKSPISSWPRRDKSAAGKETRVHNQPKQPTAKGPAEWFTGDVWIDGIARGGEPSRVRVSAVRFSPSARTAWHSHAVGQTLYVTEGDRKSTRLNSSHVRMSYA